ncbi:5-methylthioadenosine/S-adenosylhomocysteine deaminase [Galdieria sulphuraria]|uniref:S-methyl-5'-thioadenosine phosphorylase n=1 Tax=Galdieria sulphuraria TaxID=130081 RepID=M2XRJ9_GALSU|nr:S-methyl-5'-thioadenosine phosphorylase [Galdieria sulphuraria]EME26293.1 S-methyl-5'-thioadenosine phosphorylase [Galdieria sulphuraria]GJD09449.1 5-methylthioadenosine/S-adenosylhomocysteine deaminase [Galdieria sulphuraria]|eukprot:XP_005702813.1 S-methyl-5'-thioadenosine phosphorylase [Galdieria sulphuraria]
MAIAVIGGTALLKSNLFAHFQPKQIETKFGKVILYVDEQHNCFFLQRHHADVSLQGAYSLPHLINHRANLVALSQCKVQSIIAICSVGSLKPTLAPGTIVVPNDFVALFSPPISVFDDNQSHIVPAIHPNWRENIISVLQQQQGVKISTRGVYVQTQGPRFETATESLFLSQLGDVVGMTAATEAVLASELGIPYAMVCSVDNYANGIASQTLSTQDFQSSVIQHQKHVEEIVSYLVDYFVGSSSRNPSALVSPVTLDTRELVDVIIHAQWIITMDDQSALVLPSMKKNNHSMECYLKDHSLVIHNGIIQHILPFEIAQKSYQAKEQEYLDNHCLLPGFINAHSHAGLAFFRGMKEEQNLNKWLRETIWPMEDAYLPIYLRDATFLAVAEMIRSGITCFNDMYWIPRNTCEVATQVGIRAMVGIVAIEFQKECNSTLEYIDKGQDVWQEFQHCDILHFCYAPHAPYTVNDQTWQVIIQRSLSNGLPIHTHLHETNEECDASMNLDRQSSVCHLSESPERPLSNLKKLGLLNCHVIAAHMVEVNREELEWLATCKQFHVVHCPTSNMKLGCGFCPIERLLDAGINVALGTDSCGSNNSLDMLQEIKTAALLSKGRTKDSTSVPAYEALSMATSRAARALGLEDRIGSLTRGKAADVIAIDLKSFVETSPVYNPMSSIVYSAKREQVTDVWVQGRRLLKNRSLTTLSLEKVLKHVDRWQEFLASQSSVEKVGNHK